MTKNTRNVLRTAAFALALSAAFGVAEAQAGDFVPPINGTGWDGEDQTPPAVDYGPTLQPVETSSYPSLNPSTDAEEPANEECEYDFNDDGFVDFADYLEFLSAMSNGAASANAAQVSFDDLIGLLSAWGAC